MNVSNLQEITTNMKFTFTIWISYTQQIPVENTHVLKSKAFSLRENCSHLPIHQKSMKNIN